MKDKLKYFWKNWNESILFLLSIALFFAWPNIYRIADATAGAFDAGMLHIIPSGFMITQFVLFSSWLSYKMSFPLLHAWFDDKLEHNTVIVDTGKFKVGLFSMAVYWAYVLVHTAIFIALI